LQPPVDRLRAAGWLVGLAAGIVVLCILTVTLDSVRGFSPQPDAAASLCRAIGLCELALTSAGREARRPDGLPTSIDWRYLPALPRDDPGVFPLLDAGQLATTQAATP
jgi:hypothetical protein